MKKKPKPGIFIPENAKNILLTMKISLILILITVFNGYASDIFSQNTRMTVDMQNVTVKEVISEIENLEGARGQANMTYEEINDDFLVLLSNTESIIKQQEITITGSVTDGETGEYLPGVTIIVQGTSIGTVTDIDGNFSISVTDPNAILRFSFVGYNSISVPIEGRSAIDVTLEPSVIAVDEVVVVGYGTQRRINLTGSVDQISSQDFENMTVPNISRALQGLIPNLNIDFVDGRPTTSPSYNIRGVTSIGAGGNALILVDGVEGDPRTLNPKDIESVTVLKDAASAAIYGARGVFGVVLITTKKPEREPQLNYTANFSTNRRTATRDVLINSAEWAKRYSESYDNLYRGTRTVTTIGAIGLNFSQEYLDELVWRDNNPGHGKPEVDVDPATGHYMYYGETDWWDLLYQDNIPSMEHALTASGGGDNASYSISGRYYTQDGLYKIRSDNYNDYSIRLQGNVRPMEWLNLASNVSYSAYDYTDPFEGSSIWNSMYIRCGATPMAVVRNPDGTLTQAGSISIGRLEDGIGYTTNTQNQILVSFNAEASIIENMLALKGDFSYRNRTRGTDRKYVPLAYSNYPGQITRVGDSRLWANNNNLDYYSYNLYGDFAHSFNDNHTLQIVGGTNIEISNYTYLNVDRYNLLIEDLNSFNLATGDNFGISGSGSDWANLGFFSRINYQFREKYLFEINSRYDGSSKFPLEEQFGFFPSFSIGWRVNEENFMANTRDWLDNLKPRVSYGSLGNSMISPYLFQQQMGAGKTGRLIQGNRPVVTRPPAVLPDDFTWETSTTFNLGLDIDLFQYKLSAIFDWYRRTTSDMITAGPTLPATFGAATPRGNYADLETEGFELTLRWNDQIQATRPLTYGVRLTLSDNVTHITKFYNPRNALNTHPDQWYLRDYYEGMQIGELWGLTTEGLFVDQADIDNHADQSFIRHNLAGEPPEAGDVKFKDINNDGKIDWGDRTVDNPGDRSIIGNTSPRYNFGIGLNANYGAFALSSFFQGVGKRDWYPTHHQNPFWGPYGFWAAEIPTHFIESGNAYYSENQDPDAYWPLWKGNTAYLDRQLQAQTRYMQNTAYIRLKELTLAYTLPEQITQRIGMKQMRIYFTGYNIWTYSPVFKITRDIDPEQLGETAGRGDRYPMLKSYTLGLSLNF